MHCPRSATEVADELRELLRVAGVPAPYLLVGHSLGGLYARRFTQRFPDEVAALLLLVLGGFVQRHRGVLLSGGLFFPGVVLRRGAGIGVGL